LALVSVLAMGSGCAAPRITADPVYFPPPPGEAHVVHLKSFNGLHELVPPRAGLLASLRGRFAGPHVGTPAGVAYRDGHLYICDIRISAVHDWDLATGTARRLGLTGEGVLAKPVAVAVDDRGTVYVADTKRAEVVAFEAGGAVRRIQPAERESYKPTAVTVRGGKLYVANIATHRVDVFSTVNGKHLASFGEIGSEAGRLYYPMGVAVVEDGQVFVSDMMNARVQVFDGEHNAVLSMGRPGNRYGDMGKPRHLAIGPDGTIFIADTEFAHVHVYNDRGQLLMMFGGPEPKPGGTPMPVGVAVAATLPQAAASLVPHGFEARYFVFVTNTIGSKRISLFAVK
jgi:DNA-binding beta-propeller fold protein YncE